MNLRLTLTLIFMKLFTTNNRNTVSYCSMQFNFELSSALAQKRSKDFVVKYRAFSENTSYCICHSCFLCVAFCWAIYFYHLWWRIKLTADSCCSWLAQSSCIMSFWCKTWQQWSYGWNLPRAGILGLLVGHGCLTLVMKTRSSSRQCCWLSWDSFGDDRRFRGQRRDNDEQDGPHTLTKRGRWSARLGVDAAGQQYWQT